MRTIRTAVVLTATILSALPVVLGRRKPAPKPSSRPAATRPAITYVERNIEGWPVHVEDRLVKDLKPLGDKALRLLEVKLYEINRVVPAKALAELHKVNIWLHVDNKPHACAAYHPSAKWLSGHGLNPKMARCVEIANASRFLSWSFSQPSMVLHELAHAYHHQVLGYANADIKAAYKRAVASKSYEAVLRYSGKTTRHYALNNDQEYFAEATEAYFGTNDFYPFVRAELQKHDPEMYKVIRKVWNR